MGVFNNKVEIEELKKRLSNVEAAIEGGVGAKASLKLIDSADAKNNDTILLKKN